MAVALEEKKRVCRDFDVLVYNDSDHFMIPHLLIFSQFYMNWASETSPTLGCSIKISRDIFRYVGLYTKNMYAKMRGRTYVVQTRARSKSVLGI